MQNSGKFITVEGIDGVGKTTQLNAICVQLKRLGVSFVCTREPGGTPLGETIRELLLSHSWSGMHVDTELLLMFAARAEHVQTVIRPALNEGRWVVCDRFTDATYAYQGGGRSSSEERIGELEGWVQGSLRPDLTVLLDADATVGLARAKMRSAADRFERENLAFFERVRQGYLKRAMQQPTRFRIIDASRNLKDVSKSITTVLDEFIQAVRYRDA